MWTHSNYKHKIIEKKPTSIFFIVKLNSLQLVCFTKWKQKSNISFESAQQKANKHRNHSILLKTTNLFGSIVKQYLLRKLKHYHEKLYIFVINHKDFW